MLIHNPFPGVVHVQFTDSYQMNMTMIRFQESYESPRFAGKDFSLEEYMDWYAYNEHKTRFWRPSVRGFDYLTRVLGTNVPGDSFKITFERLSFADDLREKEKALYDEVRGAITEGQWESGRFYVIGTYGSSKVVVAHELAHARWGLDPDYKEAMEGIVTELLTPGFQKAILKRGYSPDMVKDEAHAFALTGWPRWFSPLWTPWKFRKGDFELSRALKTRDETIKPMA